MRPEDLTSNAELAERHGHGTRVRYVAGGCRCEPCRRANTEYAKARVCAIRQGHWNGLVDAAPARLHLLALSQQGIGRRAVADACDLPHSTLGLIRSGTKRRIRAATLRRILGVDAAAVADHGFVKAGPTWKRIRRLLREGFTKAELARRLGYKTRAIQFRPDMVLARNALRVEKFYRTIMVGG